MKLNFKLLGVEIVPRWQGPWIRIYYVENKELGIYDTIRDEDYIEDGEYEVPDTFFEDRMKETEEETDEW